jgi:hypothetical protein
MALKSNAFACQKQKYGRLQINDVKYYIKISQVPVTQYQFLSPINS